MTSAFRRSRLLPKAHRRPRVKTLAKAVASALALTVLSLVAFAAGADGASRARELEGRLLAPCCWIQTLDVHESELATSLRGEIHDRLDRGESALAIEDDLAARYGERIRAVPKGKETRHAIPAVAGIALLGAAIGLAVMVRRWLANDRRAGARAAAASESHDPRVGSETPSGAGRRDSARDAYDRRIDDELAGLDA